MEKMIDCIDPTDKNVIDIDQSYLIHCWQDEPGATKPPRRHFILQEVGGEQHCYSFDTLEEMAKYLRAQMMQEQAIS